MKKCFLILVAAALIGCAVRTPRVASPTQVQTGWHQVILPKDAFGYQDGQTFVLATQKPDSCTCMVSLRPDGQALRLSVIGKIGRTEISEKTFFDTGAIKRQPAGTPKVGLKYNAEGKLVRDVDPQKSPFELYCLSFTDRLPAEVRHEIAAAYK